MAEGLKPCPFCGQEVKLKSKPGDWGYTPDTISIRCNDCEIGFVEVTQEWKPPPVGTYSIYEEALKMLLYGIPGGSCGGREMTDRQFGERLAEIGADIYLLADQHPVMELNDQYQRMMFELNDLSYRLIHENRTREEKSDETG